MTMLSLDDFNKRILRPMILSGIARGDYDAAIPDCLDAAADGFPFDDDVIAAMLKRIPIILVKKPWWEQIGEVGATLRIKLPEGYIVKESPL